MRSTFQPQLITFWINHSILPRSRGKSLVKLAKRSIVKRLLHRIDELTKRQRENKKRKYTCVSSFESNREKHCTSITTLFLSAKPCVCVLVCKVHQRNRRSYTKLYFDASNAVDYNVIEKTWSQNVWHPAMHVASPFDVWFSQRISDRI